MSFAIFKINMYFFMKFPPKDRTPEDFAKKLTKEYDGLIKRGGELISKVPVRTGNTQLMETLVYFALLKQSFTMDDVLMDGIGEGIQGYWVGATLQNAPIPIVPAPGSFQNTSLNNAFVTNIGKWNSPSPTPPSASVLPFINKLIQFIKLHLFTVQGQFLTTSLYPGFPQVPPAPGVLPWQGYMIPNIPFIFPFCDRNQDGNEENTTNSVNDVDGKDLQEKINNKVKEIEEEEKKLIEELNEFVKDPNIPVDSPIEQIETAEELRRSIMKKMKDLRCCDC